MNNTFFALAAAATISLSAYSADVYVDANSTAPAPDGSASEPYSAIAAGVAAAGAGDTVWVAGGAERVYNIVSPTDQIVIPAEKSGLKIKCSGSDRAVLRTGVTYLGFTPIQVRAAGVELWGLQLEFHKFALYEHNKTKYHYLVSAHKTTVPATGAGFLAARHRTPARRCL